MLIIYWVNNPGSQATSAELSGPCRKQLKIPLAVLANKFLRNSRRLGHNGFNIRSYRNSNDISFRFGGFKRGKLAVY